MQRLIQLLKARQKEMTVRALTEQHKLETLLRKTELGLKGTTGEIIPPIGEAESNIGKLILSLEQFKRTTIKRVVV